MKKIDSRTLFGYILTGIIVLFFSVYYGLVKPYQNQQKQIEVLKQQQTVLAQAQQQAGAQANNDGILASTILASFDSARAKGIDAATKSDLADARAQAELFYDINNYSYAGVCTTPSASDGIADMVRQG